MASASFAPILAALAVMQSSAVGGQKKEAHRFLEEFQKSSEAWQTTHSILAAADTTAEAKLFAATTLKGKIIYDLDQVPRTSLVPLRDSILSLLHTYAQGPRPLRTQLCVCIANLAIQMTEWKDVLPLVASTVGNGAGDCLLEFLRILPEEVTEGRKINLSEDELSARTVELLEDNSDNVLKMLVQYAGSSAQAASNPHLLDCISSWLREIPAHSIIQSPLLDAIINAVSVEDSFDAAVECLCTIYRDTREVDESLEVIQILLPRILSLRSKIAEAAEAEDAEMLKGVTRIYAEAGEAWIVLIARLPLEFRGLVEAVLECCARDLDREAVSRTFLFWYEFKQMLTVAKYEQARSSFMDVWSKLVDVMIKHLQFPEPEGSNQVDLFDGDREQEDKFREFRHQMGDTLKDCCEVISVTECLRKAYNLIHSWIATYGGQATATSVPHWQALEAPMFALRAMGRMVPPDEDTMLHEIIPLMVLIPNHARLRFQALMALGRYTEWTSRHPEFLQPQLNFVLAGFEHSDVEVVRAAALSFRYFGSDCRFLLKDEVVNLHGFYDRVLDQLPVASQEEITEGVAAVVGAQSNDKIYAAMKLYCDPIMERIKSRANTARQAHHDKAAHLALADTIQLLTIFIRNIQPHYQADEENQAVKYCAEVLPVLFKISESFVHSVPTLERLCRCFRYMILSYRTSILPVLPMLAQQLASGFETSRQGCFLWATDAVLREFSAGTENVDPATSHAIYNFFEQQAFAFLNIMNDLPPSDLPDVIEDFFRLLNNALMYYHEQLIPAPICAPILTASISALSLEHEPPLTATLHFIRDLLSYGTDSPNFSTYDANHQRPPVPAAVQQGVRQLLSSQGDALVQRILTGMMFTFPRDCLQDASGVLLALFEMVPRETATWVKSTVAMLPPGSVKQGEVEKLMSGIGDRLQGGDTKKVRVLLQDFTTSYRRRNVQPRDGLGKLEPERFKFSK